MIDAVKNNEILTEHAVTLGILVNSVSNIEAFMKESLVSQKNQERLMERLANFEGNTSAAFDRAHNRINELRKQVENHELQCTNKFSAITPKAEAGHRSYVGIIWFLAALGMAAVGTLYTKIWG